METIKELEAKAFIEMAQTIERQKKEIQSLRELVSYLESQVYGGTTQ